MINPGIIFLISVIGVKIGSVIGGRYGKCAEFVNGAILVLIGLRVLLEHLGFL